MAVKAAHLEKYILGDADMNGSVDASDILVISNYYIGNTPEINETAADVTKDGLIDSQDITGIQQIYLNSSNNINRQRIRRK